MLTAVAHFQDRRKAIIRIDVARPRAILHLINGVENGGRRLGFYVMVLIIVVHIGMAATALRLVRR